MTSEKLATPMEKVAVLIPTRNRPDQLRLLLKSIAGSNLKPDQVIIVASGEDIEKTLLAYKATFNITYKHTNFVGQISQKRLGVGLIRQDIDWCLFIDDDLLLYANTLEIALETANSYPKENVIGIGLSLTPTSRTVTMSLARQKISQLLKLSSNKPGKVLSSGHASSYLQEKSVTETEWLNGASIWRTERARDYGIGLPSTPYAACEDLIFSYPNSKIGTLIYVPKAKVDFQESELSQLDSFPVMESAALWRFYFINEHKEMSFGWFFLAQIIRAFFAVSRSRDDKLKLIKKLFGLNLKLLKAQLTAIQPKSLLERL
jgi:glycosyltransferase involved in cell wall biosynthesis